MRDAVVGVPRNEEVKNRDALTGCPGSALTDVRA